MTMLGAGFLAGAALLVIWVAIVIAKDRDDADEINLQEYDDWERLRGPSSACGVALPQSNSNVASSNATSLGGNAVAGLVQ